jgi:hypothetical protein
MFFLRMHSRSFAAGCVQAIARMGRRQVIAEVGFIASLDFG